MFWLSFQEAARLPDAPQLTTAFIEELLSYAPKRVIILAFGDTLATVLSMLLRCTPDISSVIVIAFPVNSDTLLEVIDDVSVKLTLS